MSEALAELRDEVGYAGLVGVVYGFRTLASDEFRYVGQTSASVRRRSVQHYRSARGGRKTPFYDWLRKTPEQDVFAVPLELVWSSLIDLGEAEKSWILKLRAEGHRLLNLTDGGLGPTGQIWTSEMRAAASARGKGRPGVSRRGPDAPMWGYQFSDEQKAIWSAQRKGMNSGAANPNYGKFGEDHPSFGHKMSAESRARLSEMRRGENNPNYGRTMSEDHRAMRSAALRGRPMPSSVRSAHTRHHTNKGVFKETCRHCIDDRDNERDES